MENGKYKIIRLILAAIPILFFVFLLNKKFNFWGDFKVDYDFSYRFHPFISGLRPDERIGEIKNEQGEFYQIIKGEPVYFDIETPKNFKNLDMEITYKTKDIKDLKVGVLMDKKKWQYKLIPMENEKIENLLGSWEFIEEDGILLLERTKKFSSIPLFLNNLPARNSVAVYNYDLKNDLFIADYQPRKELTVLNNRLKGYHQFYTYLKNEPLDFTFYFSEDEGEKIPENDRQEINIYHNGEFIDREILSNDEKIVKLYKENLDEGAYKIELKIDDNTFINKIETAEKFLTFINKLNLAGIADKEEKVNLYTNSKKLRFATSDSSSLQDINIGGGILKVDDIYKQFNFENYLCEDYSYENQKNCLEKIEFSKSEILMQGEGLFSFSPESFLNPEIKSLEKTDDLSDVDYVISGYNRGRENNGWRISSVNFDISSIKRNANKYNFIFSSPGFGENDEIYINDVKAVFKD